MSKYYPFKEDIVNNIEVQRDTYIIYDSTTKCLALEVTPDNKRTFYFIAEKLAKKYVVKLGSLNNLTLTKAREITNEIRKDLFHLKRIRKEKFVNTDETTLRQFFNEHYLTRWAEKYTTKKTKENNISIFKKRIDKSLGNLTLPEITRESIEKLHKTIQKSKSDSAANKTLTLIKHILNKGIEWGFIKTNVADTIKKFHQKSRDRYITPEELKRMFDELEKEKDITLKGYIYISLFTGARRSNVLGMAWNDIDWDNKLLYIEHTKNGCSLTIPLIDQAIDILKEMRKTNTSKWVFPCKKDSRKHIKYPQKLWLAFLKKVNISDLHIHDMRRTLASYEAMAGVSLPLISKTLGHKSFQATQVYARMNTESTREAISLAVNLMMSKASEVTS